MAKNLRRYIEERTGGFSIKIRKSGRSERHFLEGDIASPEFFLEACRIRDTMEQAIATGAPFIPPQQEARNVEGMTLRAAFEAKSGSLRKSYADGKKYCREIRNRWLEPLGDRNIHAITRQEIEDLLNSWEGSTGTKSNYKLSLQKLLERFKVDPLPTQFTYGSREVRRKEKVIAKNKRHIYRPWEVPALMEELTYHDRQIHTYFALLFGGGFRPNGEVLALNCTDFVRGRIHVTKSLDDEGNVKGTKTLEHRWVVLADWASDILESYLKDTHGHQKFRKGLIFKNMNGIAHKCATWFNEAFRQAHLDLGWDSIIDEGKLDSYNCRRTRATELVMNDSNIKLAARQMGHSVQMLTDLYADDDPDWGQDDIMEVFKTCHWKAQG